MLNYAEAPNVIHNHKRLSDYTVEELTAIIDSVETEIVNLSDELTNARYHAQRYELNVLLSQQEILLLAVRSVKDAKELTNDKCYIGSKAWG